MAARTANPTSLVKSYAQRKRIGIRVVCHENEWLNCAVIRGKRTAASAKGTELQWLITARRSHVSRVK